MAEGITAWTWEPESRRTGLLPVCGGGAALALTLLCGRRPGPKVLVTGGVHSAEYVGVQAALELAAELRPEELTGSLAVLPLMDPTGFAHRTVSRVYEDGKNLNRVFPGAAGGTLAQRIAYTVTETLLRQASACIDLHSGDAYEELCPHVYCQRTADRLVAERSRAMSEAVDVPYLVPWRLDRRGLCGCAGALGVPAVLIERGGLGLWSREEVAAAKGDVLRVLQTLGVLRGVVPARRRPLPLERVVFAAAEEAGFWYPRRRAGDSVSAGEELGAVRDCFGSLRRVYRAEMDGRILYQTRSLNVTQGGPVVAYGSP